MGLEIIVYESFIFSCKFFNLFISLPFLFISFRASILPQINSPNMFRRCVFMCAGSRSAASQAAKAVEYMPYEPVATNPVVFMDISIEGSMAGRVQIELFSDIVPKSAENFRSLCTGERSENFYKGVPFHRIVSNIFVQGGDTVCKDGRGNKSIFGYPFMDESFEGKAGKHIPGTVALSQSAPNQNGSQFFFNLSEASHLNGKFVVVGQVLDGWEIIRKLSKCGSRCGTPVTRAWIANCGQCGGFEVSDLQSMQGVRDMNDNIPGKEILSMVQPRR